MKLKDNYGFFNCVGLSLILTMLKLKADVSISWPLVFLPLWGPPLAAVLVSVIFYIHNKKK